MQSALGNGYLSHLLTFCLRSVSGKHSSCCSRSLRSPVICGAATLHPLTSVARTACAAATKAGQVSSGERLRGSNAKPVLAWRAMRIVHGGGQFATTGSGFLPPRRQPLLNLAPWHTVQNVLPFEPPPPCLVDAIAHVFQLFGAVRIAVNRNLDTEFFGCDEPAGR